MVQSAIAGTDEKAPQQRRSQRWIYDMDAHIIDTDEDIRPFLDERYQKRKGSLLALDEWRR